jgi:acetolactate synthase I/II/III large subunit
MPEGNIPMNGAQSLVRTLVRGDVDVCFANPGTSEMHFVSALDGIEGIRCVLALFEGVATGAADGYYRIAQKPASTLLHLGPGLANGLANLHNARRAHSGIVNVVGEHALAHIALDAPLTSDIEGVARPMSQWVHTCKSANDVAADGALAVAQARSGAGKIATLILPADTAWGPANGDAAPVAATPRAPVSHDAVIAAAKALRAGEGGMLFIGGAALRGKSLHCAGQIAAKTGCRLVTENLMARWERGAGRVKAQRLPYAVDPALGVLAGTRRMVLAGAARPVAFFAYPGKPGVLVPPDCEVTELVDVDGDIEAGLLALAEELDALHAAPVVNQRKSDLPAPTGAITQAGIAQVLGMCMPENAIVVDESVTTGRQFGDSIEQGAPCDWLSSMGGAIGFGLPAALGAAIAAPDRRVISLEADGSGMYTLQALWSMAREQAKVTVLIFANRAYQILKGELAAVGAGAPGPRANQMLSLDAPALSWVQLAAGMGVEGAQVRTLEELATQLRRGIACDGPYLIEVVL